MILSLSFRTQPGTINDNYFDVRAPSVLKGKISKEHFLIDGLMGVQCEVVGFTLRPGRKVPRYTLLHKSGLRSKLAHEETQYVYFIMPANMHSPRITP